MENAKFKVGDRVKCRDAGFTFCPCEGIIAEIVSEKMFRVKVSTGDPYSDGRVWNFFYDEITPAVSNNMKVVITSDGKTTLARLYDGNKVVQKAEAVCSPDDEFDFRFGAKLAMDRLMETPEDKTEEKPKPETKPAYYTGKAVCVSKESPYYAYTVGKVYEFKDGRVTIDNGNEIPIEREPVKTIDEFNNSAWASAKFIPFVE